MGRAVLEEEKSSKIGRSTRDRSFWHAHSLGRARVVVTRRHKGCVSRGIKKVALGACVAEQCAAKAVGCKLALWLHSPLGFVSLQTCAQPFLSAMRTPLPRRGCWAVGPHASGRRR